MQYLGKENNCSIQCICIKNYCLKMKWIIGEDYSYCSFQYFIIWCQFSIGFIQLSAKKRNINLIQIDENQKFCLPSCLKNSDLFASNSRIEKRWILINKMCISNNIRIISCYQKKKKLIIENIPWICSQYNTIIFTGYNSS